MVFKWLQALLRRKNAIPEDDRVALAIEVLRRYARGEDFGPLNLLLQPVPTYMCNLNCIYCPKSSIIVPLVQGDVSVESTVLKRVFHFTQEEISDYIAMRGKFSSLDDMVKSSAGEEYRGYEKRLAEAARMDLPTLWRESEAVLNEDGHDRVLKAALVLKAFADYLRTPTMLGPEDYDRIISEASDMGVRWVEIGGAGEPMLSRELVLHIMKRI